MSKSGSGYVKQDRPWVDCRKEYPKHYDLVEVVTAGNRRMIVWWTGMVWDGMQPVANTDVKAWRKYDG